MKQIVIDARTAADRFPGIGRYVVNLSHALANIAPGLSLSLLYDPSVPAARLTLPDLPRLACPVSPFSLRQQWVVPRQLRRAQATLYHSPYYLMPYLPGTPTVLTCYDMIPLVYPAYFSATQRLIYYLAHSLALRTARVAMAISQTTRADLIRYFRLDPQRIVVTPLAADAHFQPQPPERIAAARLKYTLPERYVLYLGSNKPHKNLVRLVSAWQVASCRPALEAKRGGLQVADYKLVIAGQWDVRYPQARGRAEELGLKDQVLFAGPVDDADLPALYSGASLFVFASEYEGFGLPALEAMASGVPVVCSNTSSLPEVAGDAALLVDPLDTGALAAAIERALTDADLRQALREKGVVQAARFSWEQTAQATLAVYAQASA